MTHYEVLGVSEHASPLQIKDAYRRLVKQYHPDTNPSAEAAEFIKQINQAYDVLSDPEKRTAYDRRHHQYFESAAQEDPNETYRREFLRKRSEKEQQERENEKWLKELGEGFKKQIFEVSRWPAILLLLYACVTILDTRLPADAYEEKAEDGWQVNVSSRKSPVNVYKSFMKTKSFQFSVPNDVHVGYEYTFNPVPLKIYVTPILKRINKVELENKQQFYSWSPRSIYTIILEYALLISCVMALILKKYSNRNYYLRLTPLIITFLLILIWRW